MSRRPSPLTLSAFGLIVLIGGSNLVAVRLSNRELDPMWGAGTRFAVASVLLFGVAAAMRIGLPRGRALWGAVVFGLFNFFAFFAFAYYALQPGGVPASMGGVIFGLVPLLTLLLAVAQRIETMRARALVGAIVAAAGVTVMFGAPASADVPAPNVAAMFAAAVCAAQATIVVKRFPPSHPIGMNAVGTAVGAPLLLLVSALGGETWALPERAATWLTLGYIIPVGSVALFIIVVYVLHRWTASAVSYQFVFFPIVASIGGALVLDERVSASLAVGAALVIIGVYVGALSGGRPEPPPKAATAP